MQDTSLVVTERLLPDFLHYNSVANAIDDGALQGPHFFLFFTLVTGPRRFLSLKLSDTRVYEPQMRARLGTTAYFCRGHTVEVDPFIKSQLASRN